MGLADKDDNLLQQGWQIVEKNQGKIYDLVMDMLSYSKEREPTIEETDLNAVVRDVVELLEGRAREMNVTLELEARRALPSARSIRKGMHRALLNIVGNALDAVEDAPQRRASVVGDAAGGRTAAGCASWCVDNGTGIPPEKVEDIFRPFVSTKGSKGTGLGLAVSRKILREHGGDILVQSRAGQGQPLHPAPAAEESAEPGR